MLRNELIEKISEADMVLVGLGEEVAGNDDNKQEILGLFQKLADLLEGKNYFVVSQNSEDLILSSALNPEKITTPIFNEEDQNWDIYMKWLSGTLNKKLLLIEIGVLFGRPNVIRWPFERIAQLNEKAYLLRINKQIPQLPKELASKGLSIEDNPLSFFGSL